MPGLPPTFQWVESMGGPLIVVPVDAVAEWHGSPPGVFDDDGELLGDYGRACAVDGFAGVIAVGDAEALVLADEPSTSCFVPELPGFVRLNAADSDEGLMEAVATVLADPGVEWEDGGTWTTPGPAVLLDSANPGDRADGEQAPVPIAAGRWRVRAGYAQLETFWLTVVRLLPAGG